jgi:hypothetical protein
MNFILYHIKFPHIYNIYDDNIKFYIDLWRFTNNFLYLVYIPAEKDSCFIYYTKVYISIYL